MTEQTGRPAIEDRDPYAERVGETRASVERPTDMPVVEGERSLRASTAEAIARATAGLGNDDGKR